MKLELWTPLDSTQVLQGFGVNGDYYRANGINIKGHNGIDFKAYHGAIVRAAHDGTIVFAGEDGKNGTLVVVRTNEAREYGNEEAFFKTLYGHGIAQVPVKVGQRVSVGDIIMYANSTGFSHGDHLHFGLKPQYYGESDDAWYNLEDGNGYFGAISPDPYFNGKSAIQGKLLYAALYEIKALWIKVLAQFKK